MSLSGGARFPGFLCGTTTPLGADEVYTGKVYDVAQYATLTIFVDSDQDGTLSMQFSADGTNWDRRKVVPVDQNVGSGSVHTLETVSQYFRVVYTNGSTAQTHFRLQTLFHQYRSGFLTSSPNEVISRINDAQLIRVSNWVPLDFSRSLYADAFAIRVSGSNSDVGTASFEDVASTGVINFPTAAQTIRVAAGGNAADDNSAGAGARTVYVTGLDENYDPIADTLTLAGASASASTTNTYIRVNSASVLTSGTYHGSNTGDINIAQTTSGTVMATIPALLGRAQEARYTIRAGYTGYITRANIEIDSSKSAEVRGNAADGSITSAPFGGATMVGRVLAGTGLNEFDLKTFPALPEKYDFWYEAKADSGGASQIVGTIDLILVRNVATTVPQ